ncbi:hypothetical protein LIER_43945 [Lithospermum erythrorhizon]|uniref:Uncharacterized protein n=1 Tax=Lithospermum erythrorhizon TaxID=34254 RepID=A0AAV3RGG6_LITER
MGKRVANLGFYGVRAADLGFFVKGVADLGFMGEEAADLGFSGRGGGSRIWVLWGWMGQRVFREGERGRKSWEGKRRKLRVMKMVVGGGGYDGMMVGRCYFEKKMKR